MRKYLAEFIGTFILVLFGCGTAVVAGKDVGVFVVAGGNHTLSAHRLERDRQAVDFFRRHLGS